MTVVSTLDVRGLTAQEYRAVMDELEVETRPEGGIYLHLTTQTDFGFRVVEIWDEQAGFDRFVQQRLAPAGEAVGLEREMTIAVTPLHNLFAPRLTELPNLEASLPGRSGERAYATGKINVKAYEPTTYDQPAEGPALVRIRIVEDFSGDIEGEGAAEFLQTARGDDEASFVGVERVTGRLGGKSGTFVLQEQGTLKGTTVSGTWFVVPRSGTSALQGLRGEGRFEAELGQGADITLDYWFE
jgi:Protein of unknown function (DUF3224)